LVEIQRHGPKRNNERIKNHNKDRHGAKRHSKVKDLSEHSSSEGEEISKELFSSETNTHSQRRRKRRKHSKGGDPEEFNKSKTPILMGKSKRGKKKNLGYVALRSI
jgi:hypothetical protein